MKLGLIGEKLGHSYSMEIHNACGLKYELKEIAKNQLESFVKSGYFDGYNVTIPYKKAIIPFLDDIDSVAKTAGAVNTVVCKNGKLIGYNTDVFGMDYMIKRTGVSLNNKNVLILGSGGTSNTAKTLCGLKNVKSINVVSRSGEINYSNVYNLDKTEIIINTTPVGTYPNNGEKIIEISKFKNVEAVFDCVYNPFLTKLLFDAKKLNIKYSCGLPMLAAQAVKSEEIWLGETANDDKIEKTISEVQKLKRNIVLIGMPSSGKTTVSKLLAERLNKKVIDTDEEIIKKDGRNITKIFEESGEKYFRNLETEVIKEIGKTNGNIIACGGGSVLKEENREALKQNGVIVYLFRSIEKLSVNGRPLSIKKGVEKLYLERKNTYENFADYIVNNDGEVLKTVMEIENI